MKLVGAWHNDGGAVVSTLVVEWIEITIPFAIARAMWVSTLVVEWIEIAWGTARDSK